LAYPTGKGQLVRGHGRKRREIDLEGGGKKSRPVPRGDLFNPEMGGNEENTLGRRL